MNRSRFLAPFLLAVAMLAGCRDANDVAVGRQERATQARAGVQTVSATRTALACEILRLVSAEGGCTVDPRTGQSVGPLNAYAVSRVGYERRFAGPPTLGEIEEYLQGHEAMIAEDAKVFIGAWRDHSTNECYLDLTELIADRGLAEAYARRRQQRCIYHLATDTEIRLR